MVEVHGFENVLPVEVISTDLADGVSRVRYGDQVLMVPPCERPPGTRIFIGIRAGDVILARKRPEGLSTRNALSGRIQEISEVDGRRLVYVDVGRRLAVEVTGEAVNELGLKSGDQVVCLVKTHGIRIGPDVE